MEDLGGAFADDGGRTASGGGESPNPNPRTSSLFPIFPASTGPSPSIPKPSQDPQWPSFSFDVSHDKSAAPAPSAGVPQWYDPESSGSEGDAPAPPLRPPIFDLVRSSSSPESSDDDRRSKRKERKKKKRKRGREGSEHGSRRKSGVRAWAESDTKPAKDYYFDSRGDHDNLEFGSIYRMDVARYRLHDSSKISGPDLHVYHRRGIYLPMGVEPDLDAVDSKLRGGRYFSLKNTALERHKDFKHMKIVDKKLPSPTPGEYIPLGEWHSSSESSSMSSEMKGELEESWEDESIRRTRELNKMSRDFPHDEKVWLAFAEFQDKVASTQPHKAARRQTLEKKISILEKAVELNPDNEELLLHLLKSYQGRDTSEALLGRWEKILVQHSDSCKLWKEFLLFRQGEFSRFKVSDMRKAYVHAIQALSSACIKLSRQDHQINTATLQSTDPSLVQLELGLVDVFISLCRFEWQTGYQELATGLFQAEIEYSLFCPSLLLSTQSKQRLFEHFWNNGGARIGEDGALGWSTWLEKQDQNRQKMSEEDTSQETEVGGWSGWSDPIVNGSATSKDPEESGQPALSDDKNEDNFDEKDTHLEDDIEALLRKLGINVGADPHSEVTDAQTWNRWSEEELSRDNEQWMPVRECLGDHENFSLLQSADHPETEGTGQLSRVILYEDINEYLFSLCSKEARLSLVSQFIDFYDGKISLWTCTNSSSWVEKISSLEIVSNSILEDLRNLFKLISKPQGCSSHLKLERLFGSTNNISRKAKMMKFLRNTILHCLNAFPRNHRLEEAVLASEELFTTQMHSSTCTINPSRALAKCLLKKDRQDLLLCGIYARSEANYGNIDLARKILDMALSSTDGLSMDLQENVPLLYFWYAEMEISFALASSGSELSKQRAVHILSCLGANIKYTPFSSQAPGLQILRARQGFKEETKSLRSSWAHGDIKEYSIAFVCSASLFEFLTTGWSAGIAVIEEAFSMALPERRRRSLHLEYLWIHYIGVLQKHLKQLKFSRIWEIVNQGLQIYPYNPKTFISLVELSYPFTVPNKFRLMFDYCCQRNPSVLVYLFALSYELGKAGSEHRIHGILERAVTDDKLQRSVLLWRCYLTYEAEIACNLSAARRVFYRAIHACPWSKRLWLDGFQKLGSVLTVKELSDLQEVMRDKELNLRTDIYEILLQDETEA